MTVPKSDITCGIRNGSTKYSRHMALVAISEELPFYHRRDEMTERKCFEAISPDNETWLLFVVGDNIDLEEGWQVVGPRQDVDEKLEELQSKGF